MKKVLFFIPTLGQGGGERVVSEVSLNLPGDMETVIVLFEKKIAYSYKGKVISLNVPLSTNFFLRITKWIPLFFKFKRVLNEERPDHVVTFGGGAALIAILLGTKPIVRVDTFPSSAKKGFFGLLYRVVAKLFFPKAKAVIAVSKAAKEDLARNFGVPESLIQVLYNPLDVKRIEKFLNEPLGKEYEELFSHPVIITMSRLVKGKGLEYLLDAFTSFQKKYPEVKLVFLGEGELQATLQEKAEKLGISQYVSFLGWQENPYKFLAKAKLFAFPSFWEGFPMGVVEALACGLPVVSSDCKSGPREILAPETDFRTSAKGIEEAAYGILVPPGDEKVFEEAFSRIFSDRGLEIRLRGSAKQRAKDFSVEHIIPQWEKLLS